MAVKMKRKPLIRANIFDSIDILKREIKRIKECDIPVVCLEYQVDNVGYLGTDNHSGMHEISVPDDIFVVGFDDTESAFMFTPSISTVNRNWTNLGQAATRHILKKCNHEEVKSIECLAKVGWHLI